MRAKTPFISIIIPTYSRPNLLSSCLQSLVQLNYPRERFEVIVVDDGSRRPLDSVVQPFRKQLNLRLIRIGNIGPGPARNKGSVVALGRFLSFTDDDCLPAPDWLKKLEARFYRAPDSMIGGQIINRLTHNPYSTTSQIIVKAVYAFYNRKPESARFLASNNMAVSASLFRKIDGFHNSFRVASEDRELCDRWHHLGYKMIYAPEVVVYHSHQLTLRSFYWQHFNYGRGAYQYHLERSKRHSGTLLADMKFHLRLPCLLRNVMSGLSIPRPLSVMTLMAIWQLANACGFLYEKHATSQSRKKTSYRTPDPQPKKLS